MKFFVDNNLSEYLAKGLKEFGEDVTHVKEVFEENTEDVVWLKYIGENRMILITRDERIRKNPFELRALREYKIGVFFLGGKRLGRCKIIQQVVRNWPRIKEYSLKNRPPFAYRIPPKGTNFVKIDL
jgi:hypothetical protein